MAVATLLTWLAEVAPGLLEAGGSFHLSAAEPIGMDPDLTLQIDAPGLIADVTLWLSSSLCLVGTIRVSDDLREERSVALEDPATLLVELRRLEGSFSRSTR